MKLDGKDDLVIMCSFMMSQVVASITGVKAMAVDLYFTQAEWTVAANGLEWIGEGEGGLKLPTEAEGSSLLRSRRAPSLTTSALLLGREVPSL